MTRLEDIKRDRSALERELRAAGAKIRGRQVHCPFHDDQNASAGLYERDGVWRFKCHVCDKGGTVVDVVMCAESCSLPEALAHLGINGHQRAVIGTGSHQRWPRISGLQSEMRAPAWATPEAAADAIAQRMGGQTTRNDAYQDAEGRVVMRVVRIDFPEGHPQHPKTYRPIHPLNGQWIEGDPPGRLPLYNLPAIRNAEVVYVAEGEKCAEGLRSVGLVATTSAHGAKAAAKTDWASLAGKQMLVLPDTDDFGKQYACDVARLLSDLDPPAKVEIIDPFYEGDIADWLDDRDSSEPEGLQRQIMLHCDPWLRFTLGAILTASETWKPVEHIPTGFGEFELRTNGGLRTRGVHLLVGKPGQAKTQTAIQIAANVAMAGTPVGFFSLELGRDEAAKIITAQAAGIPRGHLDGGTLAEGYQDSLRDFIGRSRSIPLTVYDDDRWPGGLDRKVLEALVVEGVKRLGWRFVVLDYLGLLAPCERDSDEFQTDLLNSTALRRIARRNDLALLMVAALRKDTKYKDPDKTTLDDVIGAGRLTYDAQSVWSISSEQEEVGPPQGTVKLRCLKARFSRAMGTDITLRWEPGFGRVCDET